MGRGERDRMSSFRNRGDTGGMESNVHLIGSVTLSGLASEVSAVMRVVLQSERKGLREYSRM